MLPTSALHLLLRELLARLLELLRQVKPPEIQPHVKDETGAVKDERRPGSDINKLIRPNPPQVPRLLQSRSQLRIPAGIHSFAVG